MRRALHVAISGATLAFVILSWPTISAQEAVPASLADQLKAQYKHVKLGNDASGLVVTEPGTVLDLQKGGVLGVPPASMALCPAKFQDGSLKGPAGFCLAMVGKQNSRYLQAGEKVYPLRIDVNLDKDRIGFEIIECDSCNGVSQPSSYKSQVVFQFDKGTLSKTSVPQVEDIISQVLAIDPAGAEPGEQVQNPPPTQSQPADQPQPQPQTIQLGQTPDQVTAALGQPEKIVDLGSKKIYVYRDLKVTFENGKVKDVQ